MMIHLFLQGMLPESDLPDPVAGVEPLTTDAEPLAITIAGLLNNYAILFAIAFVVTLLCTPLVRNAAIKAGIVDRPDVKRKMHREPVPYLGGVAVFVGILVAIGISYTPLGGMQPIYEPIPFSIVLGAIAITFTGLADDIWGWDPRLKIAGQLVAAAALAIEDVGVKVANGILKPIGPYFEGILGNPDLIIPLPLADGSGIDIIYWVGTALIAIFVLGGCNAANLIDGLDGLLSGTIAIIAVGLLGISLLMAIMHVPGEELEGVTDLDGARIALCFALLGAVLGFLPHNFNPAAIFLGDCGSLLLGYISVVIILMFGDAGQTHLVAAGLIVFALPIMDTVLAIVRRKLSGRSMSAADDQHIHHQLVRALGGVKRAVLSLYGISIIFAVVGVSLAYLNMHTTIRVRVVYAIALVLFGSIGAVAFKSARHVELKKAMQRAERKKVANGTTRKTAEKKSVTKTTEESVEGTIAASSSSTSSR